MSVETPLQEDISHETLVHEVNGLRRRVGELEMLQQAAVAEKQRESVTRIHETYQMKELIVIAVTEAIKPIMVEVGSLKVITGTINQRIDETNARIADVENTISIAPMKRSHKIVMWVIGLFLSVISALVITMARSYFKI